MLSFCVSLCFLCVLLFYLKALYYPIFSSLFFWPFYVNIHTKYTYILRTKLVIKGYIFCTLFAVYLVQYRQMEHFSIGKMRFESKTLHKAFQTQCRNWSFHSLVQIKILTIPKAKTEKKLVAPFHFDSWMKVLQL